MTWELDDGRMQVYQWETGRYLKLIDIKECNTVNFYNSKGTGAFTVQTKKEDGVIKVQIPNEVLALDEKIRFYCNALDDNGQYVEMSGVINLIPRQRPDEYVYEESDLLTFDKVLQEANDIKKATEKIKDDTEKIKTDTAAIKTDVESLKNDVSQLKTETNQIKTDTQKIKNDTSQIYENALVVKENVNNTKEEVSQLKTETSQIKTDTQQIHDDTGQIKTEVNELKNQTKQLHDEAEELVEGMEGFIALGNRFAIDEEGYLCEVIDE